MALFCCEKIFALLGVITSNHVGDFYLLNCFLSYSTEKKLKKREKVYNDHDYCYVEMPNEDNEILNYNHQEKSFTKGNLEKMLIVFEFKIQNTKKNSCSISW